MDTFFQGILSLLVLAVVVVILAIVISYIYEKGIGKPIFDNVFKTGSGWKKLQFVIILLLGVAVAKYMGLDIVDALNKFSPLINTTNPDVSTVVTGIILTIVSSWLHDKTGLNIQ